MKQTIDIIQDMVFESGGVKAAYRDFVKVGYSECSYDLIEHVKDRLGHDANGSGAGILRRDQADDSVVSG